MDGCVFIILGATGDLARRKLFPALFKLFTENKIKNFLIVGAASDEIEPIDLLNKSKRFVSELDEERWQEFTQHVRYNRLYFEQADDFVALERFVASLEKEQGLSGNRLVYLAAPPNFFCTITEHCASSGLVEKKETDQLPWHRIVYEKPFGRDVQSAHKINECIQNNFIESQIFRIDHYLTKEIVGNIAMIRFSNCVFEPLWNNRFIDSVQVVLSEQVCIEGRGTYFDKYGALRDVVQNHVLELISLVAMEMPESLDGEAIREQRFNVLKKMSVVDGVFGQYKNYTQEAGVAPDSKTETFASLVVHVDNERWKGVPFFVRTGKCLDKKETTIYIKFKKTDCLLTKGCPMESNFLKIEIEPHSIFALNLNAKKPGVPDELIPVQMEFCHSCQFATESPESYEVIFEDVMRGQTAISVRFDEIEAAWRVIDKAYAMNFPLYVYKRGSVSPDELKSFSEKHGVRWLS